MHPVVHAGAIDRLAYLLGTRRAHRPIVLEEAQAPRLERQAAVVQQPPHFGLGIVDQGFVGDAVDAPGQCPVEVRHQPDVVAVVTADVVEAVTEVLAARELLLEQREAAGQRVPPHVDDPGVGQRQLDQADVREVVRHLVDEERRTGLALDAGAFEVAFAEFAHGVGIEPGQHLVVAGGAFVRALLAQRPRQRNDLGQLHRALDQRVAREDLLDQGRAGAGHADDEDRIRRGDAVSGPRAEEFGRVDLRGPLQAGAGGVGRVRYPRQPQRVAAGIVREGPGVLAAVLERLAEREIQVQPVLVFEVRALQLRPHRGDVGIVETEGLEVGQAPPGIAEARVEFEAAAIGGDRAFAQARGLQRVPLAEPDMGLVGMFGEEVFVQFDRFPEVAGTAQHHRPEVAIAGIAGVLGQQPFDLGQRLLRAIAAVQDHGVVLARRMEARRQLQATLEQVGGVLVAPDPRRDFGQHPDRGDIGGRTPQPAAQQRLGMGNVVVDEGAARLEQDRVGHCVAEDSLHAGLRLGGHLTHAAPQLLARAYDRRGGTASRGAIRRAASGSRGRPARPWASAPRRRHSRP